jgi:stage II sporulation protein D
MIALLLAGHLLGGAVPSPQPEGVALLWNQALAFDRDGMPMIPVGIAQGRERFEIIVLRRATLTLGQQEPRQRIVAAGTRLQILLRSGHAASVGYFVIAETHDVGQREAAERRLKYWKALGYNKARLLPLGAQMALSGTAFDNRSLALAVDVAGNQKGAEAMRHKLQTRYKLRSHIDERLLSLPKGQLEVRIDGEVLTADERIALRFDGDASSKAQFSVLNAFNGKIANYRAELEIVFDAGGQLAAVALVRAEEMVAGTVPSESYASAPIEALKSQAIAARTELFSKLGHRHGMDPYLLCGKQDCQVYHGRDSRHPRSDRATKATRGAVLFDGTRRDKGGAHPLAHAQYSAICGGHTEDNDSVWNQPPSASLRGHPDGILTAPPRGNEAALRRWIEDSDAKPWCRISSLTKPKAFAWKRELNSKALRKLEKRLGLGSLLQISVPQRGVSGRARSLLLKGSKKQVIIEPELAIRRLLGGLPSALFSLRPRRGKGAVIEALNFSGRGWGHGVGMCQMGAIGMAEAGYKADAILKHYYPGGEVRRVY